MTERIVVEPPPPEASRDRVEPRVFSRLDAIRAAERAGALAANRPARRAWGYAAAGAAVAAAIALGIVAWHEPAARPAPSLVVTPAGGSSRFTVDDAVVDAGSDTEVEVRAADPGGVTFVLARGTIDCDVAPRKGRPLRVRAGDVSVEVVGTRFSVSRTDGVRVDVTHGKVRVHAPSGEFLVGAGERWTERDAAPARAISGMPPARTAPDATGSTARPGNTPDAAASTARPGNAPDTAPIADPIADPITDPIADPVTVPDAPPAAPPRSTAPRSSRAAFQAAQRLEPRDRAAAARAYRALASGDDAWAALALYSLAELDASSGLHRDALDAAQEYLRRFPGGAGIEDVMWIRVEILRALGRPDDARRAAAAYLRRFPRGTYVRPAARVAAPR